ncbi:hypothetical protein PM082_002163 [Marasmius tenuissimus]|nr:hypothetical protein PM082_002163 [Marasmius tenuissimus]
MARRTRHRLSFPTSTHDAGEILPAPAVKSLIHFSTRNDHATILPKRPSTLTTNVDEFLISQNFRGHEPGNPILSSYSAYQCQS